MIKKIINYKSLNYSLLDQALVSGSNFLSTIIIARILGLNDFGIFATLWIILLFINSLHVSIIVFPMMSLIPKQEKLKNYFASLLVGQLLFVIIAFALALLFSLFYTTKMNLNISFNTIILFSLTVGLYHMQDFYRRYFFSLKKFLDVFIIDILTYLLRVIILIYLFMASIPLSLENIFLIFVITFLLGAIIGVIKYEFVINYQSLKNNFIEQWSLSKWLLPSGLMQWSSINLFLVVASFLLGPTIVGIIRLGQNIVMAFNVVLQGIENFIPTDASQIFINQGIKPLIEYLTKVTSIGLSFILFFGGLVAYFSKEILLLVYGNTYVEYNDVVIWYAIILIFMFLLVVFRIFLRTTNHTKIWFKAYSITSIYSLIVVYPLLTQYGIYGVLLGILSAHIVLIVSTYFMIKKEFSNDN